MKKKELLGMLKDILKDYYVDRVEEDFYFAEIDDEEYISSWVPSDHRKTIRIELCKKP
jgi:hypothetical protein